MLTKKQKDAAVYLGVSVNTLKKYESEGRIKRTKAGRATYNIQDLDRLMGKKDDRQELKTENEFLKRENERLRKALSDVEKIVLGY